MRRGRPARSAERWSTAASTTIWPCWVVKAAVMSFAIVLGPMADDGSSHIASWASGMIVPSWLRGPRGQPTRLAADRPLSRIRRRTRSLEVRRPA